MHFAVTINSKASHFVLNCWLSMTRGSNSLFCNKIWTGTSCSCKKIENYWVKQKFQGAIKLLWTKIVKYRKVHTTQHSLCQQEIFREQVAKHTHNISWEMFTIFYLDCLIYIFFKLQSDKLFDMPIFKHLNPNSVGQNFCLAGLCYLLGKFTMVSQPIRLNVVDWSVFHFIFLGRLPFFFEVVFLVGSK